MSGRSNGVGSFERIDDRILDEGRVGDGDPLEIQKLTSAGWWTGICGGWMI